MDDLKTSREKRFTYFLADIVDKATAKRLYERFDYLPDKVLETIDNEIYKDLVYHRIIQD
jgi:hypothetical protein